ncbi:hypothetical protein [uncultured Gelidibacter sp.]|uniref:hypothetical protein n=1 Tax=uncultured Gelidibacter sp. TaxID=259318 RepID=UPI002637A51E|nr:hypothetical protein [uncultured Gelidibacter sp.]
MKNLIKLTLAILLLASCKDSPESSTSKNAGIVEGVMNEVSGKNEDVNAKYDHLLKKLSAKKSLTDEELLKAFPKKIGQLKIDTNGDNMGPKIIGGQLVAGTFGDGTVRMEILDAAGEKATGAIIPLKMLHLNKVMSEMNNTIRYSKKERNGIFTFGTDRDADTKSDYQAELRFLYYNRFYVTLEGKAMDVDQLWSSLNSNDLSGFKAYNK